MEPLENSKNNPLTPDSLAAEGAGDSDRFLMARLGRYGTGKNRSWHMSVFCRSIGERKLANRLYRCASYLLFREWLAHGRVTLHKGHFCQMPLLCPVCAIRRSGRMLRRYVERARYLLATHDLWLVTLTVKNGSDLLERYLHLKGSIKRLVERAKKGYGAFSGSDGALWSIEVTKGSDGLWHPHAHMVWAMPKTGYEPIAWGKGSRLSGDWESITGDSSIVHATRIGGAIGDMPSEEQLISAFCEVLKYSLKFSSLCFEDNYLAYRALKGQRLLSCCGIWWGLVLPENTDLEDEPLDGPYIEHFYRWSTERGYHLDDVSLQDS